MHAYFAKFSHPPLGGSRSLDAKTPFLRERYHSHDPRSDCEDCGIDFKVTVQKHLNEAWGLNSDGSDRE